MKKVIAITGLCLALVACSKVSMVDKTVASSDETTIKFQRKTGNMLKSYQDMQNTGHYNFGVFAYKSTDMVTPVMPNYLVGYYDEDKAYQKAGTTWGDQGGLVDGQSYWMYEGMGNAEYHGTYAGQAITPAYTSNNANQYLKYWDNSAATTAFYAYAPYINSGVKSTVTYVDGTPQSATGADTYVMCFPNGSIESGMDNASLSEYMYACAKVGKANYGHDVALQFTRLNAKVNIKFWEDIPGYKVRILNLKEGTYEGVQAAASIKDGTTPDFGYKGGKFYKKNGVKISFASSPEVIKQFNGTVQTNSEPLVFKAPTDAQIGENRYAASASASTYYAIPKGQGNNLLADTSTDFSDAGAAEDGDFALTGFTFHVSYELTAEDTGEKIVVKNATVHVPCEYANWKPNTHYTYIFKITKSSNGSTDPADDPYIDPTDPEVPVTPALYPIVFDNCTVVDWDENESEWNISDEHDVIYHDVQLSAYSIVTGNIIVTVTDNDTYAGHGIDYAAITVTPADANITYDSATHKITVAAGAAAGVYTVTYTCPATGDKTTHPATWTEQFVVGNVYAVSTHRTVIGTNSTSASSKLNITATKDGSDVTSAASTAGQLEVVYPDNFKAPYFTAAQLEVLKDAVKVTGTDVVVKNNALPGVYRLVYTVDEGSKVKVAEQQFTVVDYSLTLSHTTVVNCATGTTVTGNQTADVNHVYSIDGPTAFTATVTPGTANVVVPNNSPEGTYTVTYTVYGGEDDETVYTKTFEVKNQYAVTLSKGTLDSMIGTSAVGDTSTDGIVVTLKNNGVETDTNLTAKLKVVAANALDTDPADANFSFVWDGTGKTITLKVKRGATKQAYKVVYEGQTDVYATANFVVK